MKKVTLILLWVFINSCTQSKNYKPDPVESTPKEIAGKLINNCGCGQDSLMNENTISCDTTILRNQSKLYYQFNCDSIWLTLEDIQEQKVVLYTEKDNFKQLYGLQYRLGYHLAKEYEKYLLFRTGCPANGPCNFVLIDKTNGKLIKEFGELIYNHQTDELYDFVLYFSESGDTIIAEFIDTGKQIKIPVKKQHFNAVIPEYIFDNISYENNIISLTYQYEENKTTKEKTIRIDAKQSHQH
jgi:hypothetical protein